MQNTREHAKLYQETAKLQEKDGRDFIQEIVPDLGDMVLDIGCGTGELTAHLANLVGPEGHVNGVDPDHARIKVAQETYHYVKNLTFVKGSADHLPYMKLGNFDLIFSNYVLHWVFDKEAVLNIVYRCLKRGGRIALQMPTAIPELADKVIEELFPEKSELMLSKWCFESKEVLENYLSKVGFKILNSTEFMLRESYDSVVDFCKALEGITHGIADVKSVPTQLLSNFAPPYMDKKEPGKVILEQRTLRILAVKN